MSLRIQIENIVSDGFDLELPREEGAADRVAFRRVAALRGTYQHDAQAFHLRQVTAAELGLSLAAWHWEGGRIVVPAEADLEGVLLDLIIARGPLGKRRRLLGAVRVASAKLRSVGFESGGVRLSAEVALTGLEMVESEADKTGTIAIAKLRATTLEVALAALGVTIGELEATAARVLHGGGTQDVAITQLRATGVATSIGGVRIRIGSVVGTEVRFHRSARGTEVAAATLDLQDLEVHLPSARVQVDHLSFADGVSLRGGAIAAEGLTAGAVTIDADLGGPRVAPVSGPPSSRPRRKKLDLHVLDHLEGRLDVDVHVDARVPFLKRRVATHRFRIPILHGCLDYKRLEKDLSLLEDSLLDFEVRKGKLVLEVKPPILRFAKKTLVEWPLEGDELALAERHRVHLRTLARAKPVKGKEAEDGEKSAFELSRLDFDPIDAELRLGGPAELDLGDLGLLRLGGSAPAIGLLRVKGAMHHRAGGGSPPTELQIGLRDVHLAVQGLLAGSARVDLVGLVLAACDDLRVRADGLRPVALAGTLAGLEVRQLHVQLGATSRRSR